MNDPQIRTSVVTADTHFDNFCNSIDQGQVKEAMVEGGKFIRTKVRQESIAREVFNGSIKLEPEDLDRNVYTDQPLRIEEIEPDSIATYVPFNGTSRRRWFRGSKFEIYFGKIESQRNRKNRYNLMTYRSDIRKMLTDNAVYDIADVEDQMFFDEVEALLALPAAAGQILPLAGGLTAANVVAALQRLVQMKYPIGKLVMTKSLHLEALKLPATSVGDAVAKQHYEKGLQDEDSLWGYPVITTVKNDIIPDNWFYAFTTQEFLGYHYHLEDATLYIKEEADMLEFHTYNVPGIGIAGHRGIIKVTL